MKSAQFAFSGYQLAFLGYLVHRYPQLLPVLDEHLQDQGGEILPFSLLSDIMRWLTGALQSNTDRETVAEIMVELETAYGRNKDLEDFIFLGFLENLPGPGESDGLIHALLGQRMRDDFYTLWGRKS